MPELTEAQKKRYEEVREYLAKLMYEQNDYENIHLIWLSLSDHARDRWFYRADQALSDPRITILDKDQDVPHIPDFGYGSEVAAWAQKAVGEKMLQSGFRRVLPK